MGTPNYPSDFGTGWTELRRKVTDSFTSANTRKALTEIRTSVLRLVGDMVIQAAGRLVVQHLNGASALDVGRHYNNGRAISGIWMRRPDGSTAFWCWGDEQGQGYLSIWDRAGNIIMSDDSISGTGLARPYLPFTASPSRFFFSGGETTVATTPTALWTISGRVQHPKILVRAVVQTPAGTPAQVRLRDAASGTVIAGPATVPASANQYVNLTGSVVHPWDQNFAYDVEVWRTAGTGTVRAHIAHAYGVESG